MAPARPDNPAALPTDSRQAGKSPKSANTYRDGEPDRPKRKPCIYAGNYIRHTPHRNENQLLPPRLRSTGVSPVSRTGILPVPGHAGPTRQAQPRTRGSTRGPNYHLYVNREPPLRLPLEALPLPPVSEDEPLVPESELDGDVAAVDDPDDELDEEVEEGELSLLAEAEEDEEAEEEDDALSLLAPARYESLR